MLQTKKGRNRAATSDKAEQGEKQYDQGGQGTVSFRLGHVLLCDLGLALPLGLEEVGTWCRVRALWGPAPEGFKPSSALAPSLLPSSGPSQMHRMPKTCPTLVRDGGF